jgi:hypothetical protein
LRTSSVIALARASSSSVEIIGYMIRTDPGDRLGLVRRPGTDTDRRGIQRDHAILELSGWS